MQHSTEVVNSSHGEVVMFDEFWLLG